MKLDKNSVIGFVLLALLFFGYFYYTRQGQIELDKKQKHMQDSIAALLPVRDTAAGQAAVLKATDTTRIVAQAGQLAQNGIGEEKLTVLENDLLKVTFTSKGAQPKKVELKKYLSKDSLPVTLVGHPDDRLGYLVNTGPNATANTADLYFSTGEVVKHADGSQTLAYHLTDSTGRSIAHQFTLKKDDYMLDWTVSLTGADKLVSQNNLSLMWQTRAVQQEHDIQSERRESQIGLVGKGGFDYFTIGKGLNKKWDEGLQWLGLKQKFFNSTLLSDNGFSFGELTVTSGEDSMQLIATSTANLKASFPASANAVVPLHLYYGPNDFKILKGYKKDMEDMVNLGQGFYAFVKYLNRWIVMPVFNFFTGIVGSYGIVILLLTLFIRLLTSPLVYTSYLSGAKMKAMKPELDVLKAKFGDDQQAYSMEQMKLFRTAGVNPLGGCIPALLQIPIFFALYSFFNSNIDLRGKHFLWSKDLSAYDTIVSWKMNLPFIGNHLSLFTILAVVTSLIISLYSMSMTPDQNNPMLKYMPYIFPVMLLGIFNGLPSALTWYYTVSNVITLALQFVIQNYIIDHDKILAQIEVNKKKPKGKSKWQERLEQMQASQQKIQDQQKKVQDMKNRTGKK
jgi:YidC/Oxa1 family membrane protein insertase